MDQHCEGFCRRKVGANDDPTLLRCSRRAVSDEVVLKFDAGVANQLLQARELVARIAVDLCEFGKFLAVRLTHVEDMDHFEPCKEPCFIGFVLKRAIAVAVLLPTNHRRQNGDALFTLVDEPPELFPPCPSGRRV